MYFPVRRRAAGHDCQEETDEVHPARPAAAGRRGRDRAAGCGGRRGRVQPGQPSARRHPGRAVARPAHGRPAAGFGQASAGGRDGSRASPRSSPAVAVPGFGYYAGPAASITARQNGQLVHASLARWSAAPGIVIFWFPGTTPASAPLTGLAAYTDSGHLLPAGNTTTGHG
jgi:hypothetical protein